MNAASSTQKEHLSFVSEGCSGAPVVALLVALGGRLVFGEDELVAVDGVIGPSRGGHIPWMVGGHPVLLLRMVSILRYNILSSCPRILKHIIWILWKEMIGFSKKIF